MGSPCDRAIGQYEQMSAGKLFRVACLVVLATTTLCVSVTPAFAAGDSTLDALIVKQPPGGWRSSPAAAAAVVESEKRVVSALAGRSIRAAAEVWDGTGNDALVVILVGGLPAMSSSERALNAREAVISACTTATGNPPASVHAFAQIRTASEAVCSSKTATGESVSVITVSWVTGNVMAIVLSNGLSPDTAHSLALAQAGALPNTGVRHIREFDALLPLGVALPLVLIGLLAIGLAIRSARRNRPVPDAYVWVNGMAAVVPSLGRAESAALQEPDA
jgi:hypothetical protein